MHCARRGRIRGVDARHNIIQAPSKRSAFSKGEFTEASLDFSLECCVLERNTGGTIGENRPGTSGAKAPVFVGAACRAG